MVITCSNCSNWSKDYYTSKTLPSTKPGRKAVDINLRTVVAFRENGKGHSDIESVCGIMNLSPPMNKTAFKKTMTRLYNSYKRVTQDNMSQVAESVRKSFMKDEYNQDEIVNIDASFDGTWQKRGFSSLNGIVTVISNDAGKCIDFHVLSKKCSGCTEQVPLSMNGSLLIMIV